MELFMTRDNVFVMFSGPLWRRHRRIISISFNKKQLTSYVTTFYEEAVHLVNLLTNYNGTQKLEQIFFHHGLNVATSEDNKQSSSNGVLK